MTTPCDAFEDSLAELALEMLDANERDALLAHAATCRRCAGELERMTAAADGLTLLAPECEPPVGFEQRVMQAIAGSDAILMPSTIGRARRTWTRPVLATAAAIVLLVVGMAIGFGLHRDDQPAASGDRVRYSDIVGNGTTLGSVSLVGADEPGSDVILTMTLTGLAEGEYHCVLERRDGTTEDLASWPIDATGFGTWALPITDEIDEVRQVAVVDGDGTTLGRTTWPE